LWVLNTRNCQSLACWVLSAVIRITAKEKIRQTLTHAQNELRLVASDLGTQARMTPPKPCNSPCWSCVATHSRHLNDVKPFHAREVVLVRQSTPPLLTVGQHIPCMLLSQHIPCDTFITTPQDLPRTTEHNFKIQDVLTLEANPYKPFHVPESHLRSLPAAVMAA